MVPKPHRLDTELGPPSWHRVSTTTVPPLATVRSSNCSSVWYTLSSRRRPSTSRGTSPPVVAAVARAVDVGVGVARARVAVLRGRAVVARKLRRLRVGAQVGCRSTGWQWRRSRRRSTRAGIRCVRAARARLPPRGRGLTHVPARLSAISVSSAGRSRSSHAFGIGGVGVEVGAARVAVAVKGKGWRRRQRRLLRLWRRRRRAASRWSRPGRPRSRSPATCAARSPQQSVASVPRPQLVVWPASG